MITKVDDLSWLGKTTSQHLVKSKTLLSRYHESLPTSVIGEAFISVRQQGTNYLYLIQVFDM